MTKARDLANIISGGFTADDIPNIPASKITSGTFADDRLPSTALNSNVDLTNLSASNLTSGSIPTARITALPAGVGGKVLQVKYMKSSAGSGLSGTSLVDTPLTNTITPSSTSSKILIQFQLQAKLEFQNTEGYGTAVKRTISGSDTTLFEQVAYQNHSGNNTGNIETGTISYYC